MKSLLPLVVFCIVSSSFVGAIEFWYSLPIKKVSCFGDSLGEKILVKIDIFSEEPSYQYRVYDPEGAQVEGITATPLSNEKLSFTTEKGGNYQFCFTNPRATPQLVKYNYRTGVDANDISDITTKEDLEPISVEVNKLEELYKNIGKEKRMVVRQARRLHNSSEDVSYKVISFSIITVLLLAILTAFQVVYLKNFFKSKKLI